MLLHKLHPYYTLCKCILYKHLRLFINLKNLYTKIMQDFVIPTKIFSFIKYLLLELLVSGSTSTVRRDAVHSEYFSQKIFIF